MLVLNNYVQVVIFDFSKAYDLINHHVLLKELRLFGISPYIVRWLAATVSMCKYVDDSTIFQICEFGGMPVIQESVDITTMWTIRNEMIIKSEKMKEMVICYAHGANPISRVPCIEVNGMFVERVEYVKLLGVTLSNDLTWNRHVDTMVQQANKQVSDRPIWSLFI